MKRKVQASLLWMVLLISHATLTWAANGNLGGGSGEPNNPYLIEDFNDFKAFCADPNYWAEGLVTSLMTDLDLDPNLPGREVYTEAVFGRANPSTGRSRYTGVPFAGTFNGNGYCLNNLAIISSSDCLGLLGRMDENGSVLNVSVVNASIEGSQYVGGLCGYCEGTIQGCTFSGSVEGSSYVGGLCGKVHSQTRMSCGGLIEYPTCISRCHVNATIQGTERVGGICGDNLGGVIGSCKATGTVWGGIVDGSFFDFSESVYVGGLCGTNCGVVIYCAAIVDVNGGDYVGGLCGANGIDSSYLDSRVVQCYATGKLVGVNYVAGICGYQVGKESCLERCLWDVIASGQIVGVELDDEEPGVALDLLKCTSAQMIEAKTYLNAG